MVAAILTIDLGRVVANWQFFVERSAEHKKSGIVRRAPGGDQSDSVDVGAVVKADAYGLGVGRVVQALYKAGCRTFFVAYAHEGVLVRAALDEIAGGVLTPGAKPARIIVFHGCSLGEGAMFAAHQLTPVLNSMDDALRWVAQRGAGGTGDAVLHVDTGMNRLGFSRQAFLELCSQPELVDALNVSMIMTHLVSADEPGAEMNVIQKKRFDDLMAQRPAGLAGAALSMANSAGVLNGPEYVYDVARVGIGLYGGAALSHLESACGAVVSLEVEVLQVREIAQGETVSYGGTWSCGPSEEPSEAGAKIATLAIGYADGLLRVSQKPRRVQINGMFAPIVGRVTMDLTMIDVTGIDVKPGDTALLLSDDITVDELAKASSTIGYEVLTSLGRQSSGGRLLRRYVGD